jgi:hypothetical protein
MRGGAPVGQAPTVSDGPSPKGNPRRSRTPSVRLHRRISSIRNRRSLPSPARRSSPCPSGTARTFRLPAAISSTRGTRGDRYQSSSALENGGTRASVATGPGCRGTAPNHPVFPPTAERTLLTIADLHPALERSQQQHTVRARLPEESIGGGCTPLGPSKNNLKEILFKERNSAVRYRASIMFTVKFCGWSDGRIEDGERAPARRWCSPPEYIDQSAI